GLWGVTWPAAPGRFDRRRTGLFGAPKKMKRWAVLTVLLYLLTLLVLTVPVVLVAFGNWWWLKKESDIRVDEVLAIYQEWGYWIWIVVMGVGQALLLLVPVKIVERRPTARRPLLAPIATAGFLLGNIFLWAVLAVLCAIFKEGAFEIFAFLGGLAWNDAIYG